MEPAHHDVSPSPCRLSPGPHFPEVEKNGAKPEHKNIREASERRAGRLARPSCLRNARGPSEINTGSSGEKVPTASDRDDRGQLDGGSLFTYGRRKAHGSRYGNLVKTRFCRPTEKRHGTTEHIIMALGEHTVAFRWSAVVLMLTCLSGLSGADRRAACPQACNCFPGTVFCSNRRLKAVPKGIPPSGMQRLYLDGNNLTLVPARAFLNYTELTNLDLSNSFIKNMEEGAFMGLNNLRSLKVNNNNMTTLRGSIFQGLYLLKSLNLKTNKLVDIFPEVFQGLYNLEHLYVSENLVNVSTRPFRHLGNLRYLEIKENSLKTLQGYSFQDLRGLYSLDVRANGLQNLEDYAFFGLNSLRNLYLSDNNLTTLGGEVLRPCSDLIQLDLDHNHLTYIEPFTFKTLSKLKELNLNYNNLQQVDPDVFFGLVKLETLGLINNRLTSISDKAILPMESLNSVHVAGNPWTCGCEMAILPMESLNSVHVAGNPWSCGCEMVRLWQLMDVITVGLHILCQQPVKFKGRYLDDLELSELIADDDCIPSASFPPLPSRRPDTATEVSRQGSFPTLAKGDKKGLLPRLYPSARVEQKNYTPLIIGSSVTVFLANLVVLGLVYRLCLRRVKYSYPVRTITMSALSEPGSHLYQVNPPVDLPKHLSSHTNLSHYSSNSDVEADTRSTIGLIDKD
ncbi:hypothetical protein Bbelb_061180 [Branchiostoma belcheri]|nr:hypothetical protein Bbelb_061180 [Branchiostoma belcheri]